MKTLKIPPIDGEHVVFAECFRACLAYAGWLVYDAEKNKKIGSYASAGEKLGCSRTFVGDMYRGEKMPSSAEGARFASLMGVSANYLLNGVPPMVADKLINIDHLLPEDQIDILTRLRTAEKRLQDKRPKK